VGEHGSLYSVYGAALEVSHGAGGVAAAAAPVELAKAAASDDQDAAESQQGKAGEGCGHERGHCRGLSWWGETLGFEARKFGRFDRRPVDIGIEGDIEQGHGDGSRAEDKVLGLAAKRSRCGTGAKRCECGNCEGWFQV